MKAVALILALSVLTACGAVLPTYRDADAQISSVVSFDPARFAGKWFEVARYPVVFQTGCSNTTAEYGVTGPGTISVLNTCTRGGEVETIAGSGRVVGPGRLKIDLNGVPFDADYWVLWVDESYRTAVIGTPSGRAGWILNRTPDIPADRWAAAREILQFNGYRLDELQMTPQAGT